MTRNKQLFFILGCSLASIAWAAEKVPRADLLLSEALEPARLSYQGCMKITHDTSNPNSAELVNVWYRPPMYYRWEFLSPDGKVARVRISDGRDEQLHLVKSDTTLAGDARHSHKKRMAAKHEFDLLSKNYDMVLKGVSRIAGQETYMVDLIPKTRGKPSQRIWIDEDSNIILGSQRFQSEGQVFHESHFVDFHERAQVPDEFFQMVTAVSGPVIRHGYDPDFLSDDELQIKTGRAHSKAPLLPGFEMESVDSFVADGFPISHYRYTDGLTTISLFETERPAKFSKKRAMLRQQNPEQLTDLFFSNDANHVFQKKMGDKYLILIGDLSPEDLQTLFQTFQ